MTEPTIDQQLTVLRRSSELLRTLVEPLDDRALGSRAYPAAWTIADVVSHIGSGATIVHRRVDDSLAGHATPDDFAPTTWDEWNAKSDRQKADDGLAADKTYLGRLEGLDTAERSRLRLEMGPMILDAATLVGLRLNEHALHTWDIHVVIDPTATLPPDATALLIDRLELIARYTGKASEPTRDIAVHATDPDRAFVIHITSDGVVLAPEAGPATTGVVLPAEAFVRLVYGRLDPAHRPRVDGDPAVLDKLRAVFPGP